MKKILILGSTGMMGSMISKVLRDDFRFQILCTYRNLNKIKDLKLKKNQIKKISISKIDNLERIILSFDPDYIINCIGLIKQLCTNKNIKQTNFLNKILPKKILQFSQKKKIKVIHLSTDCVFSGFKGDYKENDKSDAKDLYGRSKFKGEMKAKNILNIRTSIIGPEINSSNSLLNWFLKQKKVNGFNKAFFSGLTTFELSKIIINELILKNKISSGLVHISGPKISKYNLLKIIKKVYKTKTVINLDNNFKIDRSLNSNKFKKITNIKQKSWLSMIKELREFNENF